MRWPTTAFSPKRSSCWSNNDPPRAADQGGIPERSPSRKASAAVLLSLWAAARVIAERSSPGKCAYWPNSLRNLWTFTGFRGGRSGGDRSFALEALDRLARRVSCFVSPAEFGQNSSVRLPAVTLEGEHVRCLDQCHRSCRSLGGVLFAAPGCDPCEHWLGDRDCSDVVARAEFEGERC